MINFCASVPNQEHSENIVNISLTHQAESFSEAINAQFEQKRQGDSWNTQKYGNILCYTTLDCDSGQLCLDWRDIF